MVLVAVFGVALLVAVLLSGLAARTILSTSLLFLLGGALVSDGFLGLVHITPDSEIVSVTADLALFAVLFTDGMNISFPKLRAKLTLGLIFGVALPTLVIALVRFRLLGAEPKLQPLLPLAIGVILYAVCHLSHANPYLAAFCAGAVFAARSPEAGEAFEPLGESLAELAKFAALLVFGAVLTPQLFGDLSVGGYVAVVLAIVLIRPASLLLSLLGTRIERREKLVAAWFGPKGFASVVYGLLVLQAGIPQGEQAYTLIAVCIAFSIVAHSSTDVPIARLFDVEALVGIDDSPDASPAGKEPAHVSP
ncbi:cation:proton antiporter [Streptomyces sp. NPDC049813]|uniref:cation:proton antiporter domain-containing protein n=1 Tax=Streptomyces sp. NPDC049813 TaxID=3365597 RepID=UPI0037AE8D1B